MKNLAITIFIALIVVTLGLYLFLFQVRETESALVTTFGEATTEDEITDPGCHFKWPVPIQRVHKFDSRMRIYEVEIEETPTAGGEPIIVNTYVVWKIAEPLKFFNAVKTVKKAEDELLRSRIRNTQNNVIGRTLAMKTLARSLKASGSLDKAITVYNQIINQKPTENLFLELGECYIQQNQVEEAFVTPHFRIDHQVRLKPVADYRDVGLEVRPPDIVRYFVRVKPEVLSRFAQENNLPDFRP